MVYMLLIPSECTNNSCQPSSLILRPLPQLVVIACSLIRFPVLCWHFGSLLCIPAERTPTSSNARCQSMPCVTIPQHEFYLIVGTFRLKTNRNCKGTKRKPPTLMTRDLFEKNTVLSMPARTFVLKLKRISQGYAFCYGIRLPGEHSNRH